MDTETIRTYNNQAEQYDRATANFWQTFPNNTLLHQFIRYTSWGTVLNVGSGPSRDASILRDAGLDVVCLDASTSMTAMTNQKGLTTILADFLEIPILKDCFSGVWAYTSLLHVPKEQLPKALKEIHRVLEEGGILGLGMIEGDGEIYRTGSGMDETRLFTYYSVNDLAVHLSKAGFHTLSFGRFQPGDHVYLHFLARKI